MKKSKQIIFVLSICFIAVISFTSYAIYQKHNKSTTDSNDLTKLAILVDGVKQKEFPTKDSGKVFEKLECTNGGSGSWNADTWKLTINDITGPTECTVSFVEKEFSVGTALSTEVISDAITTGLVYKTNNFQSYLFSTSSSIEYAKDIKLTNGYAVISSYYYSNLHGGGCVVEKYGNNDYATYDNHLILNSKYYDQHYYYFYKLEKNGNYICIKDNVVKDCNNIDWYDRTGYKCISGGGVGE